MLSTTNNWDEQCKCINIDNLIVLCEIIDDYKLFCDDLEKLIKSKNNKDLVSDVHRVMQGKFSIRSIKYKTFIEKHKSTIEIMKKYKRLYDLTCLSYDAKGERNKYLSEDYFYDYINENKEHIETIKEVALKLKTLGFSNIQFGENLDFTKNDYYLNKYYDCDFAFLENIDVKSAYLNNPIKYKTTNSSYCMVLGRRYIGKQKGRKFSAIKVYLNSLILDSNRLPDKIEPHYIFDVIEKLADDKNLEYLDIKNSIDLNITTSDFVDQFECLKKVINKIDKVKNNEELLILLEQTQNIMKQLQKFGNKFDEEIVNKNSGITKQILEDEKKLELNRRYLDRIHDD